MADVMEDLSKRLTIADEDDENTVVMQSSQLTETTAKAELCLVGQLLTKRPFNTEAMRSTLLSLWKPTKGMQFYVIGDNTFLFQFNHVVDKRRVLLHAPWSFDKSLVLLQDFDPLLQLSGLTFTYSSFWVHVYNLPLVSMTKEVGGEVIGNKIGRWMDMDHGDDGIAWGRSMRIRVMVDITKLLRRGLKIIVSSREAVWVDFKFERLPNFCYIVATWDTLRRTVRSSYQTRTIILIHPNLLERSCAMKGVVQRRFPLKTKERQRRCLRRILH